MNRLLFLFLSLIGLFSCQKHYLPLEYNMHSGQILTPDLQNSMDWHPVSDPQRPRFGYRATAIWLRSVLRNPTDQAVEGLISAGPPAADEIHVQIPGGRGVSHFSGGDELPLEDTGFAYRTLVFPYFIPAHSEITIYFYYHFSGFNTVAIARHSFTEFQKMVREEYFFYGIYFSIFVALIFLQLGLLFFSRSQSSAYYALYLCGAGLVLFIQSGLARQFLLKDGGFLLNDGLRILALFTVTMATLFSRSFFTVGPENALFSRLRSLMRAMSIAMMALIPLFLFVTIPARSFLLNSIIILASLLIVGIALLALKERKFQASIFVASWSVFAFSLLWRFLDQLGILPHSYLAVHALEIGVLGEAVIFSYAMAVRARQASHGQMRARSRLQRIQSEIAEASNIHRRILPAGLPVLPGVRISVRYRPLLEIGGDLYGFHQVSEDSGVLFLADVSGHGLGAALDASLVWAAFRNATQSSSDPGEILTSMNIFLSSQWEDRYATAICALIDCSKRRALIATAGHPLPVVFPEQQKDLRLSGTMLGLDADFTYPVTMLDLADAKRLIFFTDGLTESRARSRESGEEELSRLAGNRHLEGELLLDQILNGLENWRKDPAPMDDITVLLLEFSERHPSSYQSDSPP